MALLMLTLYYNSYYIYFDLSQHHHFKRLHQSRSKQVLSELKLGLAELYWDLLVLTVFSHARVAVGLAYVWQPGRHKMIDSRSQHTSTRRSQETFFSDSRLLQQRCAGKLQSCGRTSTAGSPVTNVVSVATSEMSAECGWCLVSAAA